MGEYRGIRLSRLGPLIDFIHLSLVSPRTGLASMADMVLG